MLPWLLAACAAAIPLGTRLFVASVIPGFHEYEAMFVYGSDLVVILMLIVAWRQVGPQMRALFHEHGGTLLFVAFIAGLTSAALATSFWLSIYALVRLALLVAAAYAIGALASRAKIFAALAAAVAVMSVVEAGIGVAQFKTQGSLGLAKLGEPTLVSYTGAASTISAQGGRVLRVYGTFPHPNIYAAFLVLGLLSLGYWYLWCEQQLAAALFTHPRSWWTMPRALKTLNAYLTHRYFFWRLLIAAGTFVVVLGLALSFSRSGWISAGAGVVTFCAYLLIRRHALGGALRFALMLAACATAAYLLLAPLIVARAHLARSERSVNERLIYNTIGVELLQERMGGVGAGNQVLTSVTTQKYRLHGFSKVWNWEPIHNLYLLVAVELGWLGILSFLGFLGMVTWRLARQPGSIEVALALALLVALLVAGLFDHFLWTLQPGRLMLWFTIGLALSQLPVGKRR